MRRRPSPSPAVARCRRRRCVARAPRLGSPLFPRSRWRSDGSCRSAAHHLEGRACARARERERRSVGVSSEEGSFGERVCVCLSLLRTSGRQLVVIKVKGWGMGEGGAGACGRKKKRARPIAGGRTHASSSPSASGAARVEPSPLNYKPTRTRTSPLFSPTIHTHSPPPPSLPPSLTNTHAHSCARSPQKTRARPLRVASEHNFHRAQRAPPSLPARCARPEQGPTHALGTGLRGH
jgi:hypothetical protein